MLTALPKSTEFQRMVIEDLPRLRMRVLKTFRALKPGAVTFWRWEGVASPVFIQVTGRKGSLEIKKKFYDGTDDGAPVQVMLRTGERQGSFECPHCHSGARFLVYRDGF